MSMSLKSWGITFFIIGIGAWILPYLGLQFKLIMLPSLLFGLPEITSSIFFLVLGIILFIVGLNKEKKLAASASAPTPKVFRKK